MANQLSAWFAGINTRAVWFLGLEHAKRLLIFPWVWTDACVFLIPWLAVVDLWVWVGTGPHRPGIMDHPQDKTGSWFFSIIACCVVDRSSATAGSLYIWLTTRWFQAWDGRAELCRAITHDPSQCFGFLPVSAHVGSYPEMLKSRTSICPTFAQTYKRLALWPHWSEILVYVVCCPQSLCLHNQHTVHFAGESRFMLTRPGHLALWTLAQSYRYHFNSV